MPPTKKIQAVEELAAKLSGYSVAIATDIRGMSVNAMTELRQHLRAQGIEYRVVKNTLTERAADIAGRPEIKEMLEGPTGLVFGYGDPIEPIKTLVEYVRTNRLPMVVRVATLDGQVYRGAQLMLLTTLPSREVLVSQLVGQLALPIVRLTMALNRPIVGLVNVLNGPLRGLASVLRQRIAQQEGV
ncbi:MAG: 50S ribosomal protein L10 [Dehalococcoidia bacterium]